MNAVKEDVEKLVQKELESANQKFPVFHSDYEGVAVICEEIEEAEHELKEMQFEFKEMWRSIKLNAGGTAFCDAVLKRSLNLACEAIQVATMAQKFIDSQKEREKSEDNSPGRM